MSGFGDVSACSPGFGVASPDPGHPATRLGSAIHDPVHDICERKVRWARVEEAPVS